MRHHMHLKYPILMSGFLALSPVGLTQRIPQQATFAETILFRDLNHEYDNLFYSESVTSLYDKWQPKPSVIREFSFQEQIIQQAYRCFGQRLSDWFFFQANKPGFTSSHKQYLNRMVQWILPGDDAPFEPAEGLKWIGILGPDQGNDIELDPHVVSIVNGSITTNSCLENWLVKDGGYESLLVHLFVIFGQRTGHTQKPAIG